MEREENKGGARTACLAQAGDISCQIVGLLVIESTRMLREHQKSQRVCVESDRIRLVPLKWIFYIVKNKTRNTFRETGEEGL